MRAKKHPRSLALTRPKPLLLMATAGTLLLALGACDTEGALPEDGGDEPNGAAGDDLVVEGADDASDPIRIGHLAPLTGGLAHSGQDSVNGFDLYWEQVGYTAGGRDVVVIHADTGGDPDNAITQARRLVDQENVHFIVGPLGGHEGPAIEQVSDETGIPVLMSIAADDSTTQPNEVDTLIRTGFSGSQVSHPFGQYAYDELGCRNAAFIGQD